MGAFVAASSSQICECDIFARGRSMRQAPFVFRGSCSGRSPAPPQLRRQQQWCRQALTTNRQASRTSNDGEDDFELRSRAQDGHFTAKDVGALTKLMPDPKEDDIVDTGPGLLFPSNFSDTGQMMAQHGLPQGTLGTPSHLDAWNDMSRADVGREDWSGGQVSSGQTSFSTTSLSVYMDEESERDLAQAKFDYKARKGWELEQAQAKAMELHHRQMERAQNRYSVAVRLGEIMEELEQQDHYAGDEQNPVPSWIRAHFVLEQEFEEFNAHQKEIEALADEAAHQRMADMTMEALDAAMNRIHSYSAASSIGSGDAGGDPLDEFLGELIPNANIDNVASYLEDILGPDSLPAPTEYEDEAAGSDDEDEYGNIIALDLM